VWTVAAAWSISSNVETSSRKNVYLLAFSLLVVMLGYGMVMPLIPFLIERLGAGGQEMGWLVSTYSLMQMVCAPLWGLLSDRVGRKPVLAVGILGYAATMLFFGLATKFWMLFLARTLSGILSSATMPTALAYIGDNAPEKERSGGMGQLGAATGAGVIAGPLIGGLLSGRSISLPFFVGAGLAFLAFLLVLVLLHDQQPSAVRAEKPRLEAAAVRRAILSPAGLLLVLIFIMSFGLANFQGIIGLYVVDKFGFSAGQVGTLWMVLGAALLVGQGGLAGPLTKRFGEPALIRTGLVGGALGFILIARATHFVSILLAIAFFVLTLALIGPALNACISRFAGERQGTVMGLNSAIASLGRVAGPLLAGPLYDRDLTLPFWSGTVILLSGAVLSAWLPGGKKIFDQGK
jgi:DHA1 family multidrug resistance protein-like MFS transporter